MQGLSIKIANCPEEAPNYARDHADIRSAEIVECVVVGKGTKSGKPTVDFQFVAQDGSKFVAMLTGTLVQQLAAVVKGVEGRDR